VKGNDGTGQDVIASGFPFAAGTPPVREELLSLVPREEIAGICMDAYFRNYDAIFRKDTLGH
jgi:hypothetical protein